MQHATCRFNYCPSDPKKQGATILALPKHKVYKGAPNFVYAVFSADQILAALNPTLDSELNPELGSALNLGPSSLRQCQPAPPQTAKDAAGAAAYFVCDVSAAAAAAAAPVANVVFKTVVHLWSAIAQSECMMYFDGCSCKVNAVPAAAKHARA